MPLLLRTVLVIAVTLLAVVGTTRLVRRLLGPAGVSTVQGHLARTVIRLLLAVGLALAAGLRGGEHKAVLVFAVGVTYFAAVIGSAWTESRRTGSSRAAKLASKAQAQVAEGAR